MLIAWRASERYPVRVREKTSAPSVSHHQPHESFTAGHGDRSRAELAGVRLRVGDPIGAPILQIGGTEARQMSGQLAAVHILDACGAAV